MNRIVSGFLVTVQLVCLATLVATGPTIVSIRWLWLEVLGLGCGIWAVAVMPPRQWRISPEVPRDACLVRRGPYRWIRHPMYTAVLLVTASWVLEQPSLLRGCVWVLLAMVLHAKLKREETLLRAVFAEYEDYARETKRLIPGVY